MWKINESQYSEKIRESAIYHQIGKITKSFGLLYEAYLPGVSLGSLCKITSKDRDGNKIEHEAEVIGFKDRHAMLMPFDEIQGVNTESLVLMTEPVSSMLVGPELLGRVLNARGQPIDGKGPIVFDRRKSQKRSLYQKPSDPLKRTMIEQPLDLGVKVINGLLTCGKGQRVGIMAGSGVGKSVLLGMMARNTAADVNVIALIGERGREVREFIERDLGAEGLKRSVVIVATSDSSPLLRMRGAFLAATVSEYFREMGKDVLLMMDSVTRFCMAQREIGLSLGEPPASKGYTPSVFSLLPKLLERAGTAPHRGSVTGLYTVLVEGDDMDEPIADAARSILDGHIVLTRDLAKKNHFPAVDVLQSTSRVMNAVISPEHKKWAQEIREWLAIYKDAEDLINIGAYVRGASQKIDQSITVIDKINSFLRQSVEEKENFQSTLAIMHSISRAGEAFAQSVVQQPGVQQKTQSQSGMRF